MNKINKFVPAIAMSLIAMSLLVAAPALAENKPAKGAPINRPAMMKPVIVGKVSAISGNTITVTAQQGIGMGEGRNRTASSTVSATAKTYTVNAANAKVFKGNATSTVSAIIVGDVISVQGTTTSSTAITAAVIRDMVLPKGGKNGAGVPSGFTGNGQPIIAGKITAINGSTLTVTNNSNVNYTVDATNAKILKGQDTIQVSALTVGETVIVQGAINGTSVTASAVIDQKQTSGNSAIKVEEQHSNGFFGGIGQFFKRLFGF